MRLLLQVPQVTRSSRVSRPTRSSRVLCGRSIERASSKAEPGSVEAGGRKRRGGPNLVREGVEQQARRASGGGRQGAAGAHLHRAVLPEHEPHHHHLRPPRGPGDRGLSREHRSTGYGACVAAQCSSAAHSRTRALRLASCSCAPPPAWDRSEDSGAYVDNASTGARWVKGKRKIKT